MLRIYFYFWAYILCSGAKSAFPVKLKGTFSKAEGRHVRKYEPETEGI